MSAKHRQVRERILTDVIGKKKPSDPLPTERELAESFGVSRMTVRQALGALRDEGVISSVRGVGTFVATPRVSKAPTLTSFSEDLVSRGYVPSTIVLSASLEEAGPDVAIDLGIPVRAKVFRIERLRLADGLPMCHEEVYLHAERFPGLLETDLTHSLYATLEQDYGVTFRRGAQNVRAVNLSAYHADLLATTEGAAALHMKRITTDESGKIIERGVAMCRGDLYDYHYIVTRP
jgi:GntR family transcriptional regulator